MPWLTFGQSLASPEKIQKHFKPKQSALSVGIVTTEKKTAISLLKQALL
jgi:hypothetical protein